MKKSSRTRTEEDFLGSVKIPSSAYYGAYTFRAKNNFRISGIHAPECFKQAMGVVKLAGATTNFEIGLIGKKEFSAIKQACTEFIDGKFQQDFCLDIFQAGAGTGYNMNANEIIANRANELLGKEKGKYAPVHPNNHVNMAQSSNDVMPTATRIAVLLELPTLLEEIKELEKEIDNKIKKYGKLIKVARTHLQDAVPITFGQEFDSYKQAIMNSAKLIKQQAEDLKILGIGGTAVGTGINADPKFQPLMIKNLTKLTKIQFKKAPNATEIANNMNSFMNFSSGLRSLATNLLNFMNDLKIMNMGPRAGLSEISLPKVQPGSSIMAGKINPSVPESVEMVCFQVLGNDRTIELAAQKSNFELNVHCPIIMYNLLQSIHILTTSIRTLRLLGLKNMEVNESRIKELLERSLSTATGLVPLIGYEKTAEIVKAAIKNNTSIKQELIKQNLFKKAEIDKILNPKRIIKPQSVKKSL
ncbi:MAG: aspartate ammonia-lyase [Candidatus Gracilibacteria bacterium]|jgi:fumarate hydratase class II